MKKITALMLIISILLTLAPSINIFASEEGIILKPTDVKVTENKDSGLLVQNTEFYKNLDNQGAYELLNNAKTGASTKPFVLVWHSRTCLYCKSFMPEIKNFADNNEATIYTIDYGNTLGGTRDNADFLFNYLDDGVMSVTYPVVFTYDGSKLQYRLISLPTFNKNNFKLYMEELNFRGVKQEPVATATPQPTTTAIPTPTTTVVPTPTPTPTPTVTVAPTATPKPARPGINLDITGTDLVIPLNGTVKIKAESDQVIYWKSGCGNTVIVGYTSDGKNVSLCGAKAGSQTVTAETADGKYKKVLNVTVANTPAKQVSGQLAEMVLITYQCYPGVGYEYEPNVFITYPSSADRSTIKFESSNPEIATVDKNGKIHCLKEGTVDIMFTHSSFNITNKTTVYIYANGTPPPKPEDPSAPPTPVTMTPNKEKMTLVIGEYNLNALSAGFSDGKDRNYKFSSSNPSVLKIVNDIELVAMNPGKVTVTITSGDLTATCEITVINKEPKPTVTPKPTPTTKPTSTPKPSDNYLNGASDWAKGEIKLAKEAGLTYDSILGNYQQNITRAEFCKLAVNFYKAMGGELVDASQSPFSDTSDKDILIANALGIVNGTSDTTFEPNAEVTREQLAAMMMRAIKKFHTPNIVNDLTKYADYNQISSWAIDSLSYLNQEGIIKGISDREIAPLDNTTREQAILIAYRALNSFEFDANINNGTYKIVTATNSENCVGIASGSKNDGADAITWTDIGVDDQKFKIEKVGNKYSIKAIHSGKALTPSGEEKNGTTIVQKPYDGGVTQLYNIVDAGNGYVSFVSNKGYFVSVSAGSANKGTNIILWEKTGNTSQKFKLIKAD